ncbi:hypothetical protein SAMN04244572_04366 [Azotobacter beijerinckii]|uniref:Uncharacterized protein n=1 Tax=Azotobacter beijerinckii TaxID=170623 RepID=A0A1H6ZIB1_9GAMM|nr:hypothetical protein [Azotobacter beijerinckii]SEJ53131.1 hypothetical protein SAMN04244572_04366 [Azotobacter beijerinckii]
MLKKLFALFRRKKETTPPKPERRPSGAVPPARMPARSYSSGRPDPSSQPSSDNPMLNPLHPLSPANPIYGADDCRRSSYESSVGSGWGGSDSGSSSSSSCD